MIDLQLAQMVVWVLVTEGIPLSASVFSPQCSGHGRQVVP